MNGDRPVLGLGLMLAFCVMAPLGDSIAKILGDRIPLVQLLALRFALQAVFLAPFFTLGGRSLAMTPRLYRMTALRTLLHIAGVGAMFLSLRFLPLADALAIAFVMPFIMLLLGRFVLNEEVGALRLAACAVGFAGTLMVIQPNFVEVGLPALLPLVVAVAFALFMLVTRQIAKDIDPIALQAVSGVMATILLVPLIVLGAAMNWDVLAPVAPVAPDWILILVLGGLGTAAHLVMTWSLRFAPASTLAPMQYLEIPVATVLGYLIFRDFPDLLALAGIAVITASGLFVVFRERAISRAAVAPAPAPPPAT